MLSALLMHENGLNLAAAVDINTDHGRRFAHTCRKYYIPALVIFPLNADSKLPDPFLHLRDKYKLVDGQSTAYLCHDKVCQAPINSIEELDTTLREKFVLAAEVSGQPSVSG